jgi:hypothetical protein
MTLTLDVSCVRTQVYREGRPLPLLLAVGRESGKDMKPRVRALDRERGEHLEGTDDEELYQQARDHVYRAHSKVQLSDEQIHGILAEGTYDE